MTSSARGGRPRSTPRTQRYVAFLRAINVGGHVVKMETLRGHFARLGFTNVETFIASGNVIFESAVAPAELETLIAGVLQRKLGYEVATFVRSPAELAVIVQHQPFDPTTFDYARHRLYVGFLGSPPSGATARQLAALRTMVDELHVAGRELYWGCRTSFSETDLSGGVLERVLGVPMTMRNITTVRRLAAKYA